MPAVVSCFGACLRQNGALFVERISGGFDMWTEPPYTNAVDDLAVAVCYISPECGTRLLTEKNTRNIFAVLIAGCMLSLGASAADNSLVHIIVVLVVPAAFAEIVGRVMPFLMKSDAS